jgi:putative long chain acyl-CoA synthase
VAVAAVTLRPGRELSARELTGALGMCDPHTRPQVVHVVDEIPVTTWYRPITGPLRDRGIPSPEDGVQAFALDEKRQRYRALSVSARRRLAATGRS